MFKKGIIAITLCSSALLFNVKVSADTVDDTETQTNQYDESTKNSDTSNQVLAIKQESDDTTDKTMVTENNSDKSTLESSNKTVTNNLVNDDSVVENATSATASDDSNAESNGDTNYEDSNQPAVNDSESTNMTNEDLAVNTSPIDNQIQLLDVQTPVASPTTDQIEIAPVIKRIKAPEVIKHTHVINIVNPYKIRTMRRPNELANKRLLAMRKSLNHGSVHKIKVKSFSTYPILVANKRALMQFKNKAGQKTLQNQLIKLDGVTFAISNLVQLHK